jgi:hypothetical protein
LEQLSFIERLKGLPILFPLVGLFHIVLLCITIFGFGKEGLLGTSIGGGTVLEWLLYTVLWVFVCLQYRWAAIGYICLTAINLLLYFLSPKESIWHLVSDTLLPFDILMCVFLLFYYKRFR